MSHSMMDEMDDFILTHGVSPGATRGGGFSSSPYGRLSGGAFSSGMSTPHGFRGGSGLSGGNSSLPPTAGRGFASAAIAAFDEADDVGKPNRTSQGPVDYSTTSESTATTMGSAGSSSVRRPLPFSTPEKSTAAPVSNQHPLGGGMSPPREEITTEREWFTPPPRKQGSSTTTADHYQVPSSWRSGLNTNGAPSRSPVPHAPTSTLSALGRAATQLSSDELSHNYFALLRQTQLADSPPQTQQKGSEGETPTQQFGTSASPPATTAAPHRTSRPHPQEHIISRQFQLTQSGGATARSPTAIECTITRSTSSPSPVMGDEQQQRWSFNCGPEVSTLVNMGDAALVRLIAQRSIHAVETEMYHSMLQGTSQLALKLRDELSAEPPHGQDQQPLFGDGEVDEEPTTTPTAQDALGNDLWDLSKKLLSTIQEDAEGSGDLQGSVTSLLSLLGDSAAQNRVDAAKVLSRYLDHVKNGDAREGSPSTATDPNLLEAKEGVAQLKKREAEAKSHGNLSYGAQIRKDLINKLQTDLLASIECSKNILEPDAEAKAVQMETQSFVLDQLTASEANLENLRSRRTNVEANAAALRENLSSVVTGIDTEVAGLMSFLQDNKASVLDILSQMDGLQSKLEILVHERNTTLQRYTEAHGANVVRHSALSQQLEQHTVEGNKVESRLANAEEMLRAYEMLRDMQPAVDKLAHKQRANERREAAERKARTVEVCRYLYSELRSNAASWIDVLSKNQSRESDKIGSLQRSVEEATDRYHQQDKDLYTNQLNDTLSKKAEIGIEMKQLEQMLLESSALMHSMMVKDHEAEALEAEEDEETMTPVATSPGRPFSAHGSRYSDLADTPQPIRQRPTSSSSMFGVNTPQPHMQQHPHQHHHFDPAAESLFPTAGGGAANPHGVSTGRLGASASPSTRRNHPGTSLVAALDFASTQPTGDCAGGEATSTALFASHGTTPTATPAQRALIPLPPETLQVATTLAFDAHGQPTYNIGDGVMVLEDHVPQPRAAGGRLHPTNSANFALLDVDQLTVDQFLPLFQKSDAIAAKWRGLLLNHDVECVQDLRDIRDSSASTGSHLWADFLSGSPLLKAQIELLLDSPERFFPEEEE